MSTVARLNPDLDIFMGHAQEATTMTTNGHAANRLAELTAPAKGNNLGDILDQLTELDPASIDAELEALNRRVQILMNLKNLVGTGVTPAPKAESLAPAGGVMRGRLDRIVIFLHTHGPTTASDLARGAGIEAKALAAIVALEPKLFQPRKGRKAPYSLSPQGRTRAQTLAAGK